MALYDVASLLASVRGRAAMPDASGDFTDAVLLSIANEEMEGEMTSLLVSLNQGYLETLTDTPLVAGQEAYALPPRAVDGTLKDAAIVDASGAKVRGLTQVETPAIPGGAASGEPSHFMFRGDSLVLLPKPQAAGRSLRLHYAKLPPRLVLAAPGADESTQVELPKSLHPALAQLVAARVLGRQGYREDEAAALAIYATLREAAVLKLANRAQKRPAVLVNRQWF